MKHLKLFEGFLNERDSSHTLTKQQYDYLLPVFGPAGTNGKKLLSKYDPRQKVDSYYFIGTDEEFKDALNRCKYMKESEDISSRKISDIAKEIKMDWKNVNYAAKPYLDAMMGCDTLDSKYGSDDCAGIVSYFLSNASQWKGDKAKAIKKELNSMLKKHYK